MSAAAAAVLLLVLGAAGAETWASRGLKVEAAGILERLTREDEIQLLPGVRLVKEAAGGGGGGEDLAAELAREHPGDMETRLNAFLVRRGADFLRSHSLSVRLPDPGWLLSDNTHTGRGKDKGGKGAGMLLAAAAMMKATLGALGIGAVMLLAGKALMTGLLALMLAGIVGLKSLAGGGGHHVSYEVVSKPIVSHVDTHSHEVVHEHGHHGHSSYGRSFDTAPGAAPGEQTAAPQQPAASEDRPRPVYSPAQQHAYVPLTAPGRDLPASNT